MLVQHNLRRQVRATRSGSARAPQVDNGKVEIVVFVDMDNILADAQATMERFTAELGRKI